MALALIRWRKARGYEVTPFRRLPWKKWPWKQKDKRKWN